MKKTFIFVLAMIVCGIVLFNPQRSKAESIDYGNQQATLTVAGGNVVNGYINLSNTCVILEATTLPIDGYQLDESSLVLSVNGAPISLAPTITDEVITYKLKEDLKSIFITRENLVSIEAIFVNASALEGDTEPGISQKFSVAVRADFESPVANITSPKNGSLYNQDVNLDFTTQDELADQSQIINTKIYLDGNLTSLMQGEKISTSEGIHEIKIVTTDGAGNVTQTSSSFTYDKLIYFNDYTTFDGTVFRLNDKIFVKGWTEAGSKVALRFTGYDPEAIANQDGYFEFTVDASDMGTGEFSAFIDITDPAGNFYSWDIGHITIKRVKIAQSKAIKSDATALVATASNPVDIKIDDNVAKVPQIKSIATEKEVGRNWSAWIILLFAIVLASGISTIGYYGYEWLFGSSGAVVNEHITERPGTNKPTAPKTNVAQRPEEKEEDQDKSLRW